MRGTIGADPRGNGAAGWVSPAAGQAPSTATTATTATALRPRFLFTAFPRFVDRDERTPIAPNETVDALVVDCLAMTTHEPELTQPVDLCTPDGRRLAPAARGWSRVPLHTGNLRGSWGRTKRWDYWAILAGDWVISLTYADVDYLGIAEVWWCDLRTGNAGGRAVQVPFARGISLPDVPGTSPLRFGSSKLDLAITDDAHGTTIMAWWTDKGGAAGSLNARIDQPDGHESLNVVIPWSDRTFQYTSKHQARAAHGTLEVGDQMVRFGASVDSETEASDIEAWGVLDVGRGRWPYSTRWNWGGGAGHTEEGSVVGIQLGAKWTEGTGFTENGIMVDGVLTKIGEEMIWDYDWERPMHPWRVRHPDGSLDLVLEPRFDKHSRVQAVVLATEVHQVFGTWSGHVTSDDGVAHHLVGIQGFAEESRSRW